VEGEASFLVSDLWVTQTVCIMHKANGVGIAYSCNQRLQKARDGTGLLYKETNNKQHL
jgi:hypothetical protein